MPKKMAKTMKRQASTTAMRRERVIWGVAGGYLSVVLMSGRRVT